MLVYRIERQKYLQEVLSGRGAALSYGNRWNSINTHMVYTSGSRSLAMLEVLTRVDLFSDLPEDRLIVTIEIQEAITIGQLDVQTLPANWNSFPPSKLTQTIGDDFIRNAAYPILQVPSSLVKGEFNFLINPFHPAIVHITVVESEPIDLKRWR
jgi:RES domain-containing protein